MLLDDKPFAFRGEPKILVEQLQALQKENKKNSHLLSD